jgi:hypothetical protein
MFDHVLGLLNSASHLVRSEMGYGFLGSGDVPVNRHEGYFGRHGVIHGWHQRFDIDGSQNDPVNTLVNGIAQIAGLRGGTPLAIL